MRDSNPSVSLVMPAYNEEQRIMKVMPNYYSFLKNNFSDFEFIIVCNNCSDKTPEIVEKFSRKDKRIIFMNIPRKIGKGGAVIEGFKKASKDLIGFTDADSSTSPEQFCKLLAPIVEKNFDAAVASRALKESIVPKKSIVRVILGRFFSVLVKVLFGLKINDTQCGAKLFRKKPLKGILSSLKITGWEFDVEVLWKLSKNGFSIAEVPITWSDAAGTKLNPVSDSFRMFAGLLKLRFS
ncbi:MAG: glycosyltransferase family 2 protein [Candidatus Diapherotrites archaeon]|nr:glycosyltransferase family 2 protein [Candidatus Diapherotrites archaeon]